MIEPVLTIAAALSVQSPFTSRAHADYDAVVGFTSDIFRLVNIAKEFKLVAKKCY